MIQVTVEMFILSLDHIMLMKSLFLLFCWCSAACDGSCLTCSGPHDTSCTSCSEGLAMDAHGRCATPITCPSNHYSNQDGECHLCHKYCHECSGPYQDQCLSCNQNHYLLSEFIPMRPDTPLIHMWKITCARKKKKSNSFSRFSSSL